MSSPGASCSKSKTTKEGFMDLTKWLINLEKPSESSEINSKNEKDENDSKANLPINELVEVEWYPIQSGFFTIYQQDDKNKQVRVKIGVSNSVETTNVDKLSNIEHSSTKNDGFFKMGKGKYSTNLTICHSKEKDAIFFSLPTCYSKASFNRHFLTMTIKSENHIQDLQVGDLEAQHSGGTVTCTVKFALEETAQCFENALRKVACVLIPSSSRPQLHRLQIDRIGNYVPLCSVSAITLGNKKEKDNSIESSCNKIIANSENNGDKAESKLDVDSAMETEQASISSEDEARILKDLINTFSNPYSQHVQKAIQLYLTGNNNAIGTNLARDVQNLINNRQNDIEKYVKVLRTTNMFKRSN